MAYILVQAGVVILEKWHWGFQERMLGVTSLTPSWPQLQLWGWG